MFSFSASPGGRLIGGAFARNSHRMEEGRSKLLGAKTLYSCGYEEPCRWLPCGLGRDKVNGKMRDFHNFLRFLWVKCRFLPDFGLSSLSKPAFGAGLVLWPQNQRPIRTSSTARSFQPEKHLSFGREAGCNRRVERVNHGCGDLEVANHHVGNVLFESGLCRKLRGQPPLAAANQIHSRMLARESLRWAR